MTRLLFVSVFSIFSLFALVGCDEEVNINLQEVACEIHKDGLRFGNGVLVGVKNGKIQSIAVLTARHVITGCHNAPITIQITVDGEKKILDIDSDINMRWETIEDTGIDSTWLVLNQNEIKRNPKLHYVTIHKEDDSIPLPKRGELIQFCIEQEPRRYKSYTTSVPMPFPRNEIFKGALVRGGVIDGLTEPSESGSPVFLLDDNRKVVRLLGTSTGSNKLENITIFMTLIEICPSLHDSLLGSKAKLLNELPNLW